MYLANVDLMLFDIVCKNTDKIYQGLGLLFCKSLCGDGFISQISGEEIGLITDVDQHLFVERSMR